jgi:hypothetical protein
MRRTPPKWQRREPGGKPKPDKPAKVTRPAGALAGPDPGFPAPVKLLIMATTGGVCGAPALAGVACWGPVDPHHRLYVGMGGTRLAEVHSPANGYPLCRAHHDWVHAHPVMARKAGLKVLRNAGRPGRAALVPIRLPGVAVFWLDSATGERVWDPPEGYEEAGVAA